LTREFGGVLVGGRPILFCRPRKAGESVNFVDPLASFSVWWYGGVAVVYSLLCLTMATRESARVFSKQNAMPVAEILTIHLKFLTFLLVMMWLAPFAYPHLPDWMKDTFVLPGVGSPGLISYTC
jgi:hypothetical protein